MSIATFSSAVIVQKAITGQQRVGALWRWRRVSGGGCSSDSSEPFQAGSDSFLPLPSPFFVFRSPSPSLPCPRRPDPEEAAAVAAAEFSVKVFHFSHPLPPPTPSINIILLKILRCQAAKVENAIAEVGASPFSASLGGGGSRGAPQHYPKTAGNSEFSGETPGQNAQKWIPARSTRRDDNSAANNSANEKERHDAIFRKVRHIKQAYS